MHFGVKNGSPDFLEFQLMWLESCLKQLQEMGVTILIQTGDLFDTRAHIKLNVLHAIMNRLPGLLEQYGIEYFVAYGGNHDMFYRDSNAICSLDILRFLNYKNGTSFLIHDTEIGSMFIDGKRFAFVPWLNKNNQKRLLDDLAAMSPKPDYVFGHFEMVGMPMIPGVLCEHGLEIKDFKNFTQVISGHFHTISQHLNCTMVGTPYHITWGDVQDGTNRGFWTLDTDCDILELHKNEEHMTLFSVIEYDKTTTYDENYFLPYEGTIVKALVKDKDDPKHYKKFVDQLAKTKLIDYKIIDTTIAEVEKVQISEEVLSLDTISAMKAFIDGQQADEIDKTAVKKLAEAIYMEALSVE